jgi:shikimate kinase
MEGYYDQTLTHRLERPLCMISFLNGVSQTVGRALAAYTGMPLTILDDAVAHRLGASFHQVFPTIGLGGWREQEASELERALKATPPGILVLGEGALTNPRSRAMVVDSASLLHLRQSLEEIRRLLVSGLNMRSLTLQAEASVIPGDERERLDALYDIRVSEYSVASVAVEVGGSTFRRTARELIALLEERGTLLRV